MEVRSVFCVLLSCDIHCIFAHKNAQTDNQTKNKVKNMQKNAKKPKSLLRPFGFHNRG